MLTREEQIQLIIGAKFNKEETLNLIVSADIMYEKDRKAYKDIIKANTLYGTLIIYDSLDTAARDKFIEIINH